MKVVLAYALPIVFLGLFVGAAWYLAARLGILLGWTRAWPLRVGVLAALFGSMSLMLVGARSTASWIGVVNIAGGYLFTFVVFLLLLLLLLRAVQAFWPLPGRAALAGVAGLAAALTLTGALLAEGLAVDEVEIPMEGLPQDVVIMHISDVHIGHHRGRDRLAEIVAETNRHRPDLVVINGDLVDSDAALEPGVLAPLADFDAPVYFVGGNHDGYVDAERALAQIRAQGVRVLHNQIVETHGLQLVGLDYMNPDDDHFDMHPSADDRTIASELPMLGVDPDRPAVLLHHSPVGAEYVAAAGVDLMLSGHTHGGQMFPATLLAPLIFPFNQGLYDVGDLRVFVSLGAGTFGPRIRLGSSNEINLLRLKAAVGP